MHVGRTRRVGCDVLRHKFGSWREVPRNALVIFRTSLSDVEAWRFLLKVTGDLSRKAFSTHASR